MCVIFLLYISVSLFFKPSLEFVASMGRACLSIFRGVKLSSMRERVHDGVKPTSIRECACVCVCARSGTLDTGFSQ